MEGGRERARVLLSGEEEKKRVDLGLGAPSLVSSLIFLRTRSLTYMSLEVHIVYICGHSGMKSNKCCGKLLVRGINGAWILAQLHELLPELIARALLVLFLVLLALLT